jgi:hypothetical protein
MERNARADEKGMLYSGRTTGGRNSGSEKITGFQNVYGKKLSFH